MSRCSPKDQSFQLRLVRIEHDRVQREEYVCSDRSDPLVPVDKWMPLNEVKQIGGGHFVQVGMEELIAHAGLRHVNGRVESRTISYPKTSTVFDDPTFVEAQHLLEREKDRHAQR